MCGLYKNLVQLSELEGEDSRSLKPGSLISVYEGSQTEAGKKEIIDLVQRRIFLEELAGIKNLIEVIEAKHRLVTSENIKNVPEKDLPKVQESNKGIFRILRSHIRKLLFEGERPIISTSPELLEVAEKLKLLRTTENEMHESEVSSIINRWVGTLIKWDIERALESQETESIWELLGQVNQKELTAYITNDEEIQEILEKVGDAVCWSTDMMTSLLSK